MTLSPTNIPTLHLAEYLQGTHKDKNNFVAQIKIACRDVGFFYLGHHGVAHETMNQILQLTRHFFSLPNHIKHDIDIIKSPCCRGYGKLLAEKTLGVGDYKETFDLGLEKPLHPDRDKTPHLHLIGPNQWPDDHRLGSAYFKKMILTYIDQLLQIGDLLMRAITQSLDYSAIEYEKHFIPDQNDAFAMLRLLFYPATKQQKIGVGEHVDAGFIALLLQDDTGGLQIKNKAGQWIDVPPLNHHFIVNIGEMLQSWSKDLYQATLHRVYNHAEKDRVSAPFFFEPNLSAQIQLPYHAAPVYYGDHMLKIFNRSFPTENEVVTTF